MSGGKRKSLEDRLRAARGAGAEAGEDAHHDPPPDEGAEPQTAEPIEALLVEESESSAPAPPAESSEAQHVRTSFAALTAVAVTDLNDEISEPATPVRGHRPPAPARPSDHELSEVHDQLEALRTSASEGDTFLPAGGSPPLASVPSARPVPVEEAEGAITPPEPAVPEPASSSFLDRFSIRGARGAAAKRTPEPEPASGEATSDERSSHDFANEPADATIVDPIADLSPWTTPKNAGNFGRIGSTLVTRGLITSEQLDAALELQRSTGRRVGDSLVDMGVISPFDLVRVLADHMGVPFVDLKAKPPDALVTTLLPEDVARRYDALPVARWNEQLVIAMANPTDLFALDDLQMVIGQSIIPAMALQDDLRGAIDRAYKVSQVETTLDAAATDYEPAPVASAPGVADVNDAPVVRLVNALLDQAITDHASDLHVEPNSKNIAIRYRIDGVLHDSSEVPLSLLRPLVSRLKILANLDIAQTRLAQDGRFSLSLHGRPVDVRVVTVPTAAGESVILRLLDPTRDAFDSSNLQLTPGEKARFLPPFYASQGAAFITGPTGSGKTSTIYGVLSEINTRSKSIISVEDPVEYRLDGVKQMQINARVGVTFPTALPSVLRSDPDIVFIGEVRDSETARIAADAAITGHLVLSTLHATRAAAAPMRLVDMGVEPYLVAAALTLVAAQRLARRLCDECAEPVGESAYDLLRDLGADDTIVEGATVRRAVGCSSCRGGFNGRLPLFEIMPVTDAISRLILHRGSRAEIEQLAVAEGMDTMRVAALRRVAAGTLTIDEMMRVVS